jgi:hypothetical protein
VPSDQTADRHLNPGSKRPLCVERGRTLDSSVLLLRAVKAMSRSQSNDGYGDTPVVAEATPVGALSALLRHSSHRSRMAALDLAALQDRPVNGRGAQKPVFG